jgi:hypothetical protein
MNSFSCFVRVILPIKTIDKSKEKRIGDGLGNNNSQPEAKDIDMQIKHQ